MSRKMIDYQVEGNKISTIDGYKVGGDELTGEAIMGVSKDSDTITRTLDTDGKVKFDAKGGTIKLSSLNAFSSGISAGPTIKAGSYTLYQGGTLNVRTREYNNKKIGFITVDGYRFNNSSIYGPTIYQPEGDTGPTFLLTVSGGTDHLYTRWSISISYQCIKAGTLTKDYVIFYDINYTLGQPE